MNSKNWSTCGILTPGYLFFLLITVALSSCFHHEKSDGRQTALLFECVNLYDGVFVGVGRHGNAQISFSPDSNPMAVEALTSLKENISAACGAREGRRNRIFLVGYFTGEKTEVITKHNAPEPTKALFCLLGWHIQAPFFEQHEAPEGEAVPSPKVRYELRDTDFASPAKPIIVHREEGGLRYGVGEIDIN